MLPNLGYNWKESVSQVRSHGEWEEARSRIGIRGMTLGGVSGKYLNEGQWSVRDIRVIRGGRDHWNEEEKGKKGDIIAISQLGEQLDDDSIMEEVL